MSMPMKQPESGPLARAISAEVRAAMGVHRISGMGLAGLTGMSQNYVAKRLRDQASFTVNDIEIICKALGEDLSEMWANAIRKMEDQ